MLLFLRKKNKSSYKKDCGRVFCFWGPVFIVALIFLLSTPCGADAASLYFSPASGTYYGGENFNVSVLVNTGDTINAVSGALRFPSKYLKVLGVHKNDSIINLWTLEPSFSNAGNFGNVTFEGVVLNPGFTGLRGKILDVTFQVETAGLANVGFSKSYVLAADGSGTNVAVSSGEAAFVLAPARIPPPEEQRSGQIATTPIVLVREVPAIDNTFRFWNLLPLWVRVSVLISVGFTTALVSFILLSLGVIILIWLVGNVWHRRGQVFRFLEVIAGMIRYAWFRVVGFGKMARAEVQGDVRYSIDQLKNEFKEAGNVPSLARLVEDYFTLLRKIVKRFFTKNITIDMEAEHTATDISAESGQRPDETVG